MAIEFLKNIKRRSFFHEFVYIVLNIILAVAILIIIRTTGSIVLAFTLVVLSKWRVLAVRPRFWWANIQADLVSLIINLGYVVFLYYIGNSSLSDGYILVAQIFWTLMFIVWLLFIKSGAKRNQIVIQAGVALFMGTTAVFMVSYNWPASVVVLLMWAIGYASSRHVLSSYDEESHILFLSTVWGLVVAEISWLAYHWAIAYDVPAVLGIMIPQISIILPCLGFLIYKCYDSNYHYNKIRTNDIILPLIFTIAIVLVLVLFFSQVNTNSI